MDKVQKIREEVERLKESGCESPIVICDTLLNFIDSLQEESVSNPIDFEQELYKAFGQVKDFTLGMRIAKWFYDMGKNSHKPVSEELEEAALMHFKDVMEYEIKTGHKMAHMTSFKAGARWQITKLMANATDVEVKVDAGGYPYIRQLELYDYDKDVPLAKEGDKYKVVLIKGD